MPGPEEARDQRIEEAADRHHVADLRGDRKRKDGQERNHQPGDQHGAIVEAQPKRADDGTRRDAHQDLERKVDEVLQCRVWTVGADRKLGERGIRPIDAVDGLAMHQPVDRRLRLDQAVLLEGDPEMGACIDTAQDRAHGGDQDQSHERDGVARESRRKRGMAR